MHWARQSKTEKEKLALIELARTFKQAALKKTFTKHLRKRRRRQQYQTTPSFPLHHIAIRMPPLKRDGPAYVRTLETPD
jgi:hypothetical protein